MDSLCVGNESQETIKAVAPPRQKERGTVVPLRAVAYCKEGRILRDVPIFMSTAEVSAWFTSTCFQRGRKSVEAGEVQVKTLKVKPPGASLEEATPGSGADAVERLWACSAQIRSSASKDLLYESSLFFNSRGILAGAGCSCPIAQRVADRDAGCMGQVRCKHACALMLRILELKGQGTGGGGTGQGAAVGVGGSQFLGQTPTAKKEVNFASQALKDGASPSRKPQLVSKMGPSPRRAGKLHKYKEMTANQAANAFRRDTGDSPTEETDGPLLDSPTAPNSPTPCRIMEGDFSPPPDPDDPAPLSAPVSPQRSPPMDDPTPPPSPPPSDHTPQTPPPQQKPQNPQHPTTSTPTLHFLHNPRPAAAPFLSPTRPFMSGRACQPGGVKPKGTEGGGFPTDHSLPVGGAPTSAPPSKIDIMEEDEDTGESPLTLPNSVHLAPGNGRRAFDPGVFESIAPELPKRPARPRDPPQNTTSVTGCKQPALGSPVRPPSRQSLPQTPPKVDITTGKWLKRTPKSCPRPSRPPSAPSLALAPPSACSDRQTPEGSRPRPRKRQASMQEREEERPRKVPRGEPSLLFQSAASAPKDSWKGGLVEPSFGESVPADGAGGDAMMQCEGAGTPVGAGVLGGEAEQPVHGGRNGPPALVDTAPERLDRIQPGPGAPMVDRVLFSCGGDQDSSDEDDACALFFSDAPAKNPVTVPEKGGEEAAAVQQSEQPEPTTGVKQAALGLSGTVENVPFSLVLEEVRMQSAGMPARGRHQRSPPASPMRDRPSARHGPPAPPRSPSRSPSPRPSGGVPKVSLRALLGMA